MQTARTVHSQSLPATVVASFVKEFAFFPDFDCNDTFLELVNYGDGCRPGDGLFENMAWYYKVLIDARRGYQRSNDMSIYEDGGASNSGQVDDVSGNSDVGSNL